MVDSGSSPSSRRVSLEVNGTTISRLVESRKLLVHFLREDLGFKGVRVGCDTSSCGACAVVVEGSVIKSCTMFTMQASGKAVVTIEGLTLGKELLHPIQQAFWEAHALQCGYCTSGMIMATLELLQQIPSPTDEQIREGLSGNLCRCTGYQSIIDAVRKAAVELPKFQETS